VMDCKLIYRQGLNVKSLWMTVRGHLGLVAYGRALRQSL